MIGQTTIGILSIIIIYLIGKKLLPDEVKEE